MNERLLIQYINEKDGLLELNFAFKKAKDKGFSVAEKTALTKIEAYYRRKDCHLYSNFLQSQYSEISADQLKLSLMEKKLLRLLEKDEYSAITMAEKLYGPNADIQNSLNNLKNLIFRLRTKAKDILLFRGGKYKLNRKALGILQNEF